MDNHPNIENENGEQQEAQADEQEQIDAAAAAAETKRRHLKIDSVLARKGKFPLRNRKKINVLIEEFLVKLEDDIHDMFFENELTDADTYDALDSDRDTEEEVETALRFFPEVLSRRKDVYAGRFRYPIQELALAHDVQNGKYQCNVKTVLFIPIVARLAIEFDLFEEDERGGLLLGFGRYGDNTLHQLMLTDQTIEGDNREQQHEAVDDKFLQVLIQLRKLGLLKKEDIQRYDLLHCLCGEDYFAEKRLRFLVEWDPNALTQTDRFGHVPLDYMVRSIQGFESVFEYGIRYFPKKKGISLLFHTSNSWLTPFHYACKHFGYEKVKKIIEDTLGRYSSTPINSADALLSAAIDENVHLYGVYFLLRRDPDMLQKLLSSSPSSTSMAVADCDINININTNCINDTTDEVNSRKEKDRKRKRCID
ncbi:hypothetical protein FRACYDRAFT_249072 [Fragilariopsis cylindrus CCMP1102]|uniref:Ankyrin n=1 Tax=Fragilariopsis cylindrus CCMP1102 TaxID=635003 RepID=A0A1E7ETP0_9STRA|nr:hypothetical protein FRACYDRAFT_249072 [Fragilariopsis cylindrus CCMP1102]|eukprot:OEU09154.1 hypothetical protein FRACYDRAFT_249072 [Fragilariopsis cylindrus CCMP1102]